MAKLSVGLGWWFTLLAAPVLASAAPSGVVKSGSGDALPVVVSTERSAHFDAVARQLELGGTMFAYVDIDGDVSLLAKSLRELADGIAEQNPEAAMFQQDFDALFGDLGFKDVKAFGLSSVAAGGGLYRNRAFAYMPEGRHGIFAGLGGPSAPFKRLAHAPADADCYFEGEIDLPAVYGALRNVALKVAGTAGVNSVEAKLKSAGNEVGISALGLIKSAKGHVAGVLRLDGDQPMTIPGQQPVVIPGVSLFLRFDGIGGQLKPLLDQVSGDQGPFSRAEVAGRTLYGLKSALPIEGLQPLLALDGNDLIVATSRAFLDNCFSAENRLQDQAQFKASLAAVATEGNSLFYVSPRFFTEFRRLKELNPKLPPEGARVLDVAFRNLPKIDFPLVGVRVNRPDGVLFVSSMNRSLKQDVAMAAVYNPVTIGALVAMGLPAFQKTRAVSQTAAVENNLRQLSVAADQYYLEHGVDTVRFEDLVGPGKQIEQLEAVAGEDYSTVVLKAGVRLSVTTASGEEISFGGQ